MDLPGALEHTLLKPDTTKADIKKLCEEAVQYGFRAVCVPPYHIAEAVKQLKSTQVKVATVIGFPMGYSATPAKVEEIKRGIDEGADEFDVVINITALKSGNWNFVRNDLETMTRAVHLRGKVIKVILEASLLTSEELKKMCEFCAEFGVDFVKTSTGVNGKAELETVRTMRQLLPKSIRIKAAGGIRSLQEAQQMLEAGADTMGSSASVAIVSQIG
jgi:deoxyribose-phosphate aldolase